MQQTISTNSKTSDCMEQWEIDFWFCNDGHNATYIHNCTTGKGNAYGGCSRSYMYVNSIWYDRREFKPNRRLGVEKCHGNRVFKKSSKEDGQSVRRYLLFTISCFAQNIISCLGDAYPIVNKNDVTWVLMPPYQLVTHIIVQFHQQRQRQSLSRLKSIIILIFHVLKIHHKYCLQNCDHFWAMSMF